MRAQLPQAEHTTVLKAILGNAVAERCVCGAFKLTCYPFCGVCRQHCYNLGIFRSYNRVALSLRNGPDLDTFAWLEYELCVDTLHALRSGLYNPKARPKSLEDAA